MSSAEWAFASAVVELDPALKSAVVPAEVLREVGPFAVEAELGRGGMGQVFRVRYKGRRYALKLILKDAAKVRDRLAREARLVGALVHPGIVQLHGAGTVAGYEFLLYDLVPEGRPLHMTDLALSARVERIAQVADAVGYAHGLGIVHRDLKPDNVLVDSGGGVHVIDFGLGTHAKLDRLTQTGVLLGTPSYMAPEQFYAESTKQTAAVDVWSLGVLLYQALTSRLPFEAKTALELTAMLGNHRPAPPSTLQPEVTPALDGVCLRALSYAQEDRQPDGAAFARELREALHAPRQLRRWPGPVPAGVVSAGLVLGVAALVVSWQGKPSSPAADAPPSPDLRDPFGQLRKGNLSGGDLLRLARARLRADPDDLEARAAEAAALQELDDYVGSVSVAEAVLRQAPEDLVALRALAGSLFRLQRLPEALAVCERALALDPSADFALIYGSAIEAKRGNRVRALAFAERAVALRPDSGEALAARGAARLASGEDAEALADLDAALERQEIPQARLNRANARARVGRHAEALDDLERSRQELGQARVWQATRVLCLVELAPEEAESEALELIAKWPERAELHYLLGEAQRVQGKQTAASASYERARELEPESQWGRAAASKLKRLGR